MSDYNQTSVTVQLDTIDGWAAAIRNSVRIEKGMKQLRKAGSGVGGWMVNRVRDIALSVYGRDDVSDNERAVVIRGIMEEEFLDARTEMVKRGDITLEEVEKSTVSQYLRDIRAFLGHGGRFDEMNDKGDDYRFKTIQNLRDFSKKCNEEKEAKDREREREILKKKGIESGKVATLGEGEPQTVRNHDKTDPFSGLCKENADLARQLLSLLVTVENQGEADKGKRAVHDQLTRLISKTVPGMMKFAGIENVMEAAKNAA